MATVRKSSDAKGGEVRTQAENKKVMTGAAVEKLSEYAPEWAKPGVKAAVVALQYAGMALNYAGPFVEKAIAFAQAKYVQLEPYHPDLIIRMLTGILLMFFGGYFVTTIAVVEAFRASGWPAFQRNLLVLYESYKEIKKSSDEDDKEDKDNDGVADVLQIKASELVTRKMKLFLRTCDPERVSEALTGLYVGWVAVIATLRIQFARTISLGNSIGDVINSRAQRYVTPLVLKFVADDYKKWVPVVVSYVSKSIGVSIAWSLQRILSALHSAVRGAQIFVDALTIWTQKRGIGFLTAGYFDEAFAGGLATFGVYLQLKSFFTLNWLLSLLLFPLIVFETSLQYFVSF